MNAHARTLALAAEAGLIRPRKSQRDSALLRQIVANCEIEPERKAAGRLLKVECPACGYVARTTRKWLAAGAPICPTDNRPMICGE